MTSIGIFGSLGRMGQANAAAAPALGAQIAGGSDMGDDPADLARKADVLVDCLGARRDRGASGRRPSRAHPDRDGTTGLSRHHHALIDFRGARHRGAPDGQHLARRRIAVQPGARGGGAAGEGWDIEIVEMHHRNKADAPSGTALMLGEAAAEGPGHVAVAKPRSMAAAGSPARALRARSASPACAAGSVAGDHLVVLAGDGERIELGHRARGPRDLRPRARSARRCGSRGREPGRCTMDQVLGV
ncbi:MAG: dihydrodipicolinate reductase C-terminal domain-containing protein [Sphingomonas sp.]